MEALRDFNHWRQDKICPPVPQTVCDVKAMSDDGDSYDDPSCASCGSGCSGGGCSGIGCGVDP